MDHRPRATLPSARLWIGLIVTDITLACLLMNGPMRGGLPVGNTLEQRLQFITDHRWIWTAGWCLWMTAALGLLLFCVILAQTLPSGIWRRFGLTLVALGIVPDLTAEVIYAFLMPEFIVQGYSTATLGGLELTAMHLTGFLGNGLYNLGGLTLTLQAISQRMLKPWVAVWGVVAWLLGLALSASIAAGAMQAAEIFTASSMVLSTLWMLVFAWTVLR